MSSMNEESLNLLRGYRWLLWVIATAVLVLDQWSKAQIIESLAIGQTWRPWAGRPILEWFAFTHTKNTGAAFGIFPTASLFFVMVAVLVSLAIVWYAPRLPKSQWWLFLSLGLELGGALGNLTDRLHLGWVTDFVHIGSFAIFNVADSAIVCGVAILLVHFWYEEKQQKEQLRKQRLENWPPDELEHGMAEEILLIPPSEEAEEGMRVMG